MHPSLFQLPGVQKLHDWHLPTEPSRVPDLHCLPQEPGRRRVCHHEVTGCWIFLFIPKILCICTVTCFIQTSPVKCIPCFSLAAESTLSWSSGVSSTTRWTLRADPHPWALHPPLTSTSWQTLRPVWCRFSPRRPRSKCTKIETNRHAHIHRVIFNFVLLLLCLCRRLLPSRWCLSLIKWRINQQICKTLDCGLTCTARRLALQRYRSCKKHDQITPPLFYNFLLKNQNNKVVSNICIQSKSAASSMREWTEQETLLLLEVNYPSDQLLWCWK